MFSLKMVGHDSMTKTYLLKTKKPQRMRLSLFIGLVVLAHSAPPIDLLGQDKLLVVRRDRRELSPSPYCKRLFGGRSAHEKIFSAA